MHADQGSIGWWNNGQCLLADCGFEDLKFSNQHSTLSFSGRGQMGEAGEWWGWGWNWKPWGYGAKIGRLSDGGDKYTLVELNGDSAYVPATWLEEFRRRIVWVKPNVLIVQDRVVLGQEREIEANWITQLESWSVSGQQAGSGPLNLRVLGTPMLAARKASLTISVKANARRLQTVFQGEAGESRLVHVLWDSSDPQGWKLSSQNTSMLNFTRVGQSLGVNTALDGVLLTGYVSQTMRWDSL
jgi:hypothetical protein